MALLSKTPSVGTFTEAWTKRFSEVVKEAAGKDGRLSASEAAKIANRTDDGRVFADNAVNYLKAKGQKSVSADKLIEAGRAYAHATAEKAAGPDGRISKADQQKLPKDLFEDIQSLQGASPVPASPAGVAAELTALTKEMWNMSESESPVIPVFGAQIGTAPITAQLVASHVQALYEQHKDAMAGSQRFDTTPLTAQPVSPGDAAAFLEHHATVYDPADPAIAKYAAQWKALGEAVARNAKDLTLFRFGTVEAVYVLVGRTASGQMCGFMTGAIET